MTQAAVDTRVVVARSGFANPIALGVIVTDDSYVKVYADNTLLSEGADYEITGLGNVEGVEVEIIGAEDIDNYVGTETFTVLYDPPLDQNTSLAAGGVLGRQFESGLDQLNRRVQALGDKVSRSLRLPPNMEIDGELPWPPGDGDTPIYDADSETIIWGGPAGVAAAAAAAAAASAVSAALAEDDAEEAAAVAIAAQAAAEAAAATAANKLPLAGGTMTGPISFTHQATPAPPAAGVLSVYAKSDDRLYTQSPAGVELALGAGDVLKVADRTALKAIDTTKYTVAVLLEDGREGVFNFKAGDYSVMVATDTTEGIYVKATAIAATAGAWVRQYNGLANVKWFGAKVDNSTNDTTAAARALLVAGIVALPAGTMRVTQVTVGNRQGFVGVSRDLSIIAGTTDTPTIILDTGAIGPVMKNLTIDKVSGFTPTDGAAIHCLDYVVFGLLDNLILKNHYYGLRLGPTGWSRAENIICTNNYNHGVLMLNSATMNACQWQLFNVLSQANDGMGFCVLSVSGSTVLNLGQWTKVATYANSSYGLYIEGASGRAVAGLRLSDSFFGEDGNTEIYLNTFGGTHYINTTYFELAGRNPTGRTLSTPASNVGNGVTVTANNTTVRISDCTITGNSQAGLNLSPSTFAAVNDNEIANNGTYGLVLADGAKIAANGNVLNNNTSGNTFFTAGAHKITGKGNLPPIFGLDTEQETVLLTDFTGTDVNTAQPVFSSAQDAFSLQADTTYEFEAEYFITRAAGSTSHTTGVLFGGTATFDAIGYLASVTNPTGNVLANMQQIWGAAATEVVLTAANTSTTENLLIRLKGRIRTNAAGTLIPQFKYSAAPGGAPTVKANSAFRIRPVGTDQVATIGAWA